MISGVMISGGDDLRGDDLRGDLREPSPDSGEGRVRASPARHSGVSVVFEWHRSTQAVAFTRVTLSRAAAGERAGLRASLTE
jgi:hypothetical protein